VAARSGLSQYGEAGLRDDLTVASVPVRAAAHWALARHRAGELRYAESLEHLSMLRRLDPDLADTAAFAVLEGDLLVALARPDEARGVIAAAIARHGDTTDLCLAMANAVADTEERLGWLNRPFLRHELVPLRLRERARPLDFDNVAAAPAPEIRDGPTVTIAVPAWRAGATLGQTLRGLAAQSWRRIEVVVVDDASDDGTETVARTFAREDARFRVLRHTANSGCYAARNTALAAATGDYFVAHDADDWSHPQRIERQVMEMADHAALFAAWVRVSPAMAVTQTWKGAGVGLVKRNFSSFMVRTEDARALGGWDPVRFAGDLDFVERATHAFGPERIGFVLPDVPLSLALDLPTSLTRDAVSHMRTQAYGIRGEYVRAGRHWRAVSAPGAMLRPTAPDGRRSFPAPAGILARHAAPERYDVVLLSAAGIGFDQERSDADLVRAAARAGQRVGIFHWPVPGPGLRMRPALRQRVHEGQATVIAAGEAVRCSLLLATDLSILAWRPDTLPAFAFDRLEVLVHRLGRLVLGERQAAWTPGPTIAALLGTPSRWIPTSGPIRRALLGLAEPAAVGPVGQPPIEIAAWPLLPPPEAPAIGLVGKPGRRLRQSIRWSPEGAGEARVRSLLSRMEMLVVRPDDAPLDGHSRTILEAMASGVPCILPPAFADTYGEAARYAAPGALRSAIDSLRQDGAARATLVARGRAFAETCADGLLTAGSRSP
jgi:hypothetical protein